MKDVHVPDPPQPTPKYAVRGRQGGTGSRREKSLLGARSPHGVTSWLFIRRTNCLVFMWFLLSLVSLFYTAYYIKGAHVIDTNSPVASFVVLDAKIQKVQSFTEKDIPSLVASFVVLDAKTQKVQSFTKNGVLEKCPALKDIPSLAQKVSLNLRRTSMKATEFRVFGRRGRDILSLVEKGTRQITTISREADETGTRLQTNGTGLLDRLTPLETTAWDYMYIPGGHWKPRDCLARWKVAIIIPFRDRSVHLPILLRYLVPMLQKQLLEFAVYVINQENDLPFNRAMLMNVGFVESLKFTTWDCFVLHDVDHVPLSEMNDYGCSDMPKRMISGSNRWHYRVPYHNFFGAVTGLTRKNIKDINGFPNVYWGWGGEDDEIFLRLRSCRIRIYKPHGPHLFYKVITHHHKSAPALKSRFHLLRSFSRRFNHDGLTNLKYSRPHIELRPLYTNISVDIRKIGRFRKPTHTFSYP